MSLGKKVVLTLIGSLLVIPFYLYVTGQEITLFNLGNTFFLLSLFFFSLAALVSILRSGFFDYFQHSLRATRLRSQNEKKANQLKASQIFPQPPLTLLLVALTLLVLSLTLLFFH